ncbi:MAG: nicotinate phosphoribosyltransferase [Mangrovibacterium sp.]
MFQLEKNNGLYTDYYELTMAQGYLLNNWHQKQACFDYLFRSLPFNGGFVTFAGLSSALNIIENFHFEPEDCEFLRSSGFKEEFVRFLSGFSFKGSIWSVKEGEIIFPYEPVLRVEGSILETQLLETLLLNFLNFESLIATKASRMRLAAGNRVLLEFGLRRAQGMGGIHATKAAVSGGFNKTSNVYSASLFGLEGSGTMAHSWIQCFDNELTAFRTYAKWYPDDCVLLVDTFNTLESGIPNAITVAGELRQRGHKLKAIRLDSGDLTYLSKKARKMLDDAGFQEVKIVASNQLDEIIIQSLLDQGAPIDIFGVGTSLVTGHPDSALDGVYKLSYFDGKATIKVSENIAKMTLPGIKTIHRLINHKNQFHADGISFVDEPDYSVIYHLTEQKKYRLDKNLIKEPLMHQVMQNGKRIHSDSHPYDIASYNLKRLQQLPEGHKRFLNPQVFLTGITEQVMHVRNHLAGQF